MRDRVEGGATTTFSRACTNNGPTHGARSLLLGDSKNAGLTRAFFTNWYNSTLFWKLPVPTPGYPRIRVPGYSQGLETCRVASASQLPRKRALPRGTRQLDGSGVGEAAIKDVVAGSEHRAQGHGPLSPARLPSHPLVSTECEGDVASIPFSVSLRTPWFHPAPHPHQGQPPPCTRRLLWTFARPAPSRRTWRAAKRGMMRLASE
eukprot:1864936-Rhodomonas_salina.3